MGIFFQKEILSKNNEANREDLWSWMVWGESLIENEISAQQNDK